MSARKRKAPTAGFWLALKGAVAGMDKRMLAAIALAVLALLSTWASREYTHNTRLTTAEAKITEYRAAYYSLSETAKETLARATFAETKLEQMKASAKATRSGKRTKAADGSETEEWTESSESMLETLNEASTRIEELEAETNALRLINTTVTEQRDEAIKTADATTAEVSRLKHGIWGIAAGVGGATTTPNMPYLGGDLALQLFGAEVQLEGRAAFPKAWEPREPDKGPAQPFYSVGATIRP